MDILVAYFATRRYRLGWLSWTFLLLELSRGVPWLQTTLADTQFAQWILALNVLVAAVAGSVYLVRNYNLRRPGSSMTYVVLWCLVLIFSGVLFARSRGIPRAARPVYGNDDLSALL